MKNTKEPEETNDMYDQYERSQSSTIKSLHFDSCHKQLLVQHFQPMNNEISNVNKNNEWLVIIQSQALLICLLIYQRTDEPGMTF